MAKSREACEGHPNPTSTALAAFGLLVVLFAATAMVTFSSRDWPNPHVYPHVVPTDNACGRVGAWLSFHLIRLLGCGVFPLLAGCAFALYYKLSKGGLDRLGQRCIGVVVIAVTCSTTAQIMWPEGTTNMPLGYAGVIGGWSGDLLRHNFSGFGTFLILGYCLLAALLFTVDGLGTALHRLAVHSLGGFNERLRHVLDTLQAAPAWFKEALTARKPASAPSPTADDSEVPVVKPTRRRPQATRKPAEVVVQEPDAEPPVPRRKKSKSAPQPPIKVEERQSSAEKSPPVPPTKSLLDGVRSIVVRNHREDPSEKTGCYPAVLDDWVLPPVSLLGETESTFTAQQETLAREKARVLEDALRDFKIEAPVVQIETGPVITMFELNLAPGIKVSQITALSSDIARALKAPSVRVVAPIPGKNTVGIEVPRLDREKVRLRELIAATGRKAQAMTLPLYLGKDASGAAMVYDMTSMPHMLIAGTTGSGKSVCINSIIMSILMTQRPDRVKLILVDPKMVELSVFKDVPHLMSPIITDMNKAERILEWATTKMDERYALLAEAGVRNIAHFNRLTREQILQRFHLANEKEAEHIPSHLPYIVIVIDELADLMMTSAKEVEYHLARLAQKSRAVGIHIVVATQRPEAKVVTGLIKSNLPCRCAFRVAARMDSRIVLDQNGAEVLLGQGDMLFLPPGSATLARSQGTFIEDDEIHATVEDLRSKGKSDFHPELMKIRSGPQAEGGERDELFDDAVRVILESQRGSVSLLQRRLTIGYSRASRLVDQMADAGLVGDYKGSQAREVLMTLEEWDALKQQVAQEMAEGYAADQDDPEPDADMDDAAGDADLDPAEGEAVVEGCADADADADADAVVDAEDEEEVEGTDADEGADEEEGEDEEAEDEEYEYEYEYEYEDADEEGEEEDGDGEEEAEYEDGEEEEEEEVESTTS